MVNIPPRRRREHRHLRLHEGDGPGQGVGGRLDGRQDVGCGEGREPAVLVDIVARRVVPEVMPVET